MNCGHWGKLAHWVFNQVPGTFRPIVKHTRLGLLLLLAGCSAAREVPAPEPPPVLLPPPAVSTTFPSTPTNPAALQVASPDPSPSPTPSLDIALNFEQLGQESFDALGWHAGLALYEQCAYVGNRQARQINIVDISDPTKPARIGALSFPDGSQPAELRVLPAQHLLVVADMTSVVNLLTFDISDCSSPQPLGSLVLESQPHEFFLWSNAAHTRAFVAADLAGPPDLLVIDLDDPTAPVEIARWSAADDGLTGPLHSVSVNAAGDTVYLSLSAQGLAVADLELPIIQVRRQADESPALASFPGAHSAVSFSGAAFAVLTAEFYDCPFGGLAIAQLFDPAQPEIVAHVGLRENRCEDTPGEAVFSAHNPLVIDNLVFVSWYAGGLVALDVSDPFQPVLVGRFVPSGRGAAAESYVGDYPVQMWSYPIVRDGLIYIVDIQSGLYVLRYTGPGAEAVEQIALAEGNVIYGP